MDFFFFLGPRGSAELRRLALRLESDGATAFGVFPCFVEPGGEVAKTGRANHQCIFEGGRADQLRLGCPVDDFTVGVQDGNRSIGRWVVLSFDAPWVNPADGVAAAVFKENRVVEGWDGA